jgi:phage baseplate assembly protein W
MASPVEAFLGVGWSYPVCVAAGRTAVAVFEDDIQQAIRIILGTNPGERVMRPDFGAGMNAMVFEPMSVATVEAVKVRVREALVDWEPRIDVEAVNASVDNAEPNRLLVDVTYRVRATNTRTNLVYPFYLQEGPAR